MSKPPARARFGAKWSESDANRLNGWVEDVTSILSHGISVADNIAGLFRDVDFDGPAAELAIDVGLTRAPRAVLLGRLLNRDTGAASGVTFAWSFDDGAIVTTSFSGLAAGQYRATLLVFKE